MKPHVSRRLRLGKWLRAQSPWPFITCVLLLTAAAFCILWLKGSVPAEIMPEWISALATAGALVAAGTAAWAAYAQLRQLRIESFEREQARITKHARAVFFEDVPPRQTSAYVTVSRLKVYNSGQEPVTNVQAHYRTPDGFATWDLYGVLIPTGSTATDVEAFNVHLTQRVLPWINAEIPVPQGVATWGPHPYVLILTFRDSEGRHWLKRANTSMFMIPEGKPLYEIFPHSALTVEDWIGPVDRAPAP